MAVISLNAVCVLVATFRTDSNRTHTHGDANEYFKTEYSEVMCTFIVYEQLSLGVFMHLSSLCLYTCALVFVGKINGNRKANVRI